MEMNIYLAWFGSCHIGDARCDFYASTLNSQFEKTLQQKQKCYQADEEKEPIKDNNVFIFCELELPGTMYCLWCLGASTINECCDTPLKSMNP